MGWDAEIRALIAARRRLAEVLDLDGTGDGLEIAAFILNELPLAPGLDRGGNRPLD
jgi:hypothetical protein